MLPSTAPLTDHDAQRAADDGYQQAWRQFAAEYPELAEAVSRRLQAQISAGRVRQALSRICLSDLETVTFAEALSRALSCEES